MDCPAYRPDHNGECLTCDEWADAHTPEAIAAGEALAKTRPHAKVAEDCWKLIRALGDGEVGTSLVLKRDEDFQAAAVSLIEMACDSTAAANTAERTRALLRGTMRGYTAGENADSKHWRKRAEAAEHALNTCEIHAHVESIQQRTACAVCLTEAQTEVERLQAEVDRMVEALQQREFQVLTLCSLAGVEAEEHLESTVKQLFDAGAAAREIAGKIQFLVNWADNNKLLEDHVFTFPDGDVWEAKKR